jgi:hypothetical protein
MMMMMMMMMMVLFTNCKFCNMKIPTKTHVQEKGNSSKLRRSVRTVVTNLNSGVCFTSYNSVACLMGME